MINLKLLYFTYSQKIYTPEHFDVRIFFFFSPKKLASLILLKEVNYSPDCKMINYLTVDGSLFPTLRRSR